MARVITREELMLESNLLEKLKNSIFIYPTDTIYGIGCDATNTTLVQRLREIKQRSTQPFSILIPNKNLIHENCETDDQAKQWLDKLPGPYTLIFRVKKSFFSKQVAPGLDCVGVRIPNHWFTEVVKRMKVPIVTTSVNFHGDDFMTNLDDLNPEIKKRVDYIIYDGALKGKPSTIVHLESEELKIRNR